MGNGDLTANGTAPLQYQWRLGGTAIANATASSYTRPSVQPGDAGAYPVIVSNLAGSVTSSNAWLKLVPVPHIESIVILGDGTAQLQISGGPGNFGIDVSAQPLNWSNLTTFTATNSVFPFIDVTTNEPIRFYRVKGTP